MAFDPKNFDPNVYLDDYADQYLGQNDQQSPFDVTTIDPTSYLDDAPAKIATQDPFTAPAQPSIVDQAAAAEPIPEFTDPFTPDPVVQPAKPWRSTAAEARTPDQEYAGMGEASLAAVKGVPDLFKRQAGGMLEYAGQEKEERSVVEDVLKTSLGLDVPKYIAAASDYLFGTDTEATGKQMFDEANAAIEQNVPNLEPGSAPYYAYSSITAGLNMVPSIATTIATRNPTLGLSMMGSQVFGDKYSESLREGRNQSEATQDALVYSLAETITEKVPLGILTKEGGKFLWRIAKGSAAEAIQEPINEAIQIAYDTGVLDKDMDPDQFWSRMTDAAIVGGLVGGGMATVTHPFVGKQENIEDNVGSTGGQTLASDETRGAAHEEGIDAIAQEMQDLHNSTADERIAADQARTSSIFGPPEPAAETSLLDPVDQQYMQQIETMLADPNADPADKEQAQIMKANLARKSTQRRAEIDENVRVATDAWNGTSPLEAAEEPAAGMEGLDYDEQAAMDFLDGKEETAPVVDERSKMQKEQDTRRRAQLKKEKDFLDAEEPTIANQHRINQINKELDKIPPVAEEAPKPDVVIKTPEPKPIQDTPAEKEEMADIRNKEREAEQRKAKFEEEGKLPRALNEGEQQTSDSLDRILDNPDSTEAARKKAKKLKAQLLDKAAVPIDRDDERLKAAREKVDKLSAGIEKQRKEDKNLNKLRTKVQREEMALNKLRMQLELEDMAIERYDMNEQELADLSQDQLIEFLDTNIRAQEEYVSPAEVDEAMGTKVEYENKDLESEDVRIALQSYSEELIEGGGNMGQIVPDLSSGTEQKTSETGDALYDYNDAPRKRLGSENPEWFKGMEVNGRKPSVKEIQTSVKKAMAGGKLGPRQGQIVEALVAKAKEDIAEKGGFTKEAAETFKRKQQEDMTGLITAAEAVDPVATERALERQIPDEEVKAELREIAASNPPADEGGGTPPAPPGPEGPAGPETDLLGDDTTTAQAIADAEREKDEKRNGKGETPSLVQDPDDMFANDGELSPNILEGAEEDAKDVGQKFRDALGEESGDEVNVFRYAVNSVKPGETTPTMGGLEKETVHSFKQNGEGFFIESSEDLQRWSDYLDTPETEVRKMLGQWKEIDPASYPFTGELYEVEEKHAPVKAEAKEITEEPFKVDPKSRAGKLIAKIQPKVDKVMEKIDRGTTGTGRSYTTAELDDLDKQVIPLKEEIERLEDEAYIEQEDTPDMEQKIARSIELHGHRYQADESAENTRQWSYGFRWGYYDASNDARMSQNDRSDRGVLFEWGYETGQANSKMERLEDSGPAYTVTTATAEGLVPAKGRRSLVVIACCDKKSDTRGKAFDVYNGAYYQMMKGDHTVPENLMPDIVILSAKHGFISRDTVIDPYNKKMTQKLANQMKEAPDLESQLKEILDENHKYNDILIVGGKLYKDAMSNVVPILQNTYVKDPGNVNQLLGGIGTQRGELGLWYEGAARGQLLHDAAEPVAVQTETTAESSAADIASISDNDLADLMNEVAPDAAPSVPVEPARTQSTNFGMLADVIGKNKKTRQYRKFTSMTKDEMMGLAEKINPILHSQERIKKSWKKPQIQEALKKWAEQYTIDQLPKPVTDGFFIRFKYESYIKEDSVTASLLTWNIQPLRRNSHMDVTSRVLPAVRAIAKYYGGSVEKKVNTYSGEKTDKGIHFKSFYEMAKFLSHYTGKTPMEFEGREAFARDIQYVEDQKPDEAAEPEVADDTGPTPAPPAPTGTTVEAVEEGDLIEISGKIMDVRDYPEGSNGVVETIEEDIVDEMMMASIKVRTPDGELYSDWVPLDWLQKKGQAPDPTATTNEEDRPASKPAEKRNEKRGRDILAEAAKQGIKGADEGLKGLVKLLGGTSKFNSGFSFDEDTYNAAKPHFKSSLEAFVKSGKSIKEFITFILENLGIAMKPYLGRFVSDIRSNKVIVKGVNDAKRESESKAGPGTDSEVPRDEGVTEPAADTIRQPADEAGEQAGEEGEQQQDDTGVSVSGADAIGEGGDFTVTGEPTESIKRPDTDRQPGGGTGDIAEGVSVTKDGSDAANELADETADLEAKKPTTTDVVYGSSANISASVPQLFPEQQDDVVFAEERLFTNNKHGVLFTNGTGTGKTYTGLGIIKRQALQGKENILITVPSAKVQRDWVESGKTMGLNISELKNTKDAGAGIVVTTYANFRSNNELAKRDWDMVVHDEAHYLSAGQQGKPTSSLNMSRAITGHKLGHTRYAEAMESDLVDEIQGLQQQVADINNQVEGAGSPESLVGLENKIRQKNALFDEKKREHTANRELLWDTNTTKRLDLSATPFSYVKSVDMAEGYLFDYAPPQDTYAYNEPNPREAFFVQHFGYRMRTNRLTEPEADVDSSLMEREFNTWLKTEGSLSGRKLAVDHDYSREFILTENKIGNDMDNALKWLDDKSRSKDDPLKEAYREILDTINESMKFHEKVKLLEAIKAGDAVKRAKKHAELGRKVVIFHSRIQGGILNPFRLIKTGDPQWNAAREVFNETHPVVVNADFNEMRPLDLFNAEFGENMREYNGTITKNQKRLHPDEFNSDSGDVGVLVVQDDAGKEGISLHDNTGNHQRVLINIGLPFKPTQSIQIEGRIFRVGQRSNAVFEYFTTDTDFERWTFAGTIADRSGTAENLSMGEEARALNDSFIDAYEYPNTKDPSLEQGVGGHEADRADYGNISEFDRAKTHYFSNQRVSGRRDQREGVDYFATPEPLGMKMVEWADMQPNDSALEPSAGHGAIARYFPENVTRTFVEPQESLLSRLALRSTGRHVRDQFESLAIGGNKFDTVVMNPPYGSGGATAAKHVYKAMQHLRNGGRLVALIPEGPAADKKFDIVLNGRPGEVAKLKETIKAKRKAGESFAAEQAKVRLINNYHLVAEFGMPRVTFERAGTQVKSRIIVIDRYDNPKDVAPIQPRIDIEAENINDFFDNIEGKVAPERSAVSKTSMDIIREAGLKIKQEDSGLWIIDGDTYKNRQILRTVANAKNGDFDRGDDTWFMHQNPIEHLARALQGIPEPVVKPIDWRPVWKTPKDQEWKSTNASINKVKNPVTIGLVEKHYGGWEAGSVNADIGGGMHDNVIEYLGKKGVENVIYDPFNRSEEFNQSSVDKIKNGQADTSTINNTLNVIKEPDIRNKILREAANSLKDGGTLYIQIYEGDKTGTGRHTKGDIWQENRTAKSYLEEVQEVFPDAEIKYGLITAKNTIIATKGGRGAVAQDQAEPFTAAQGGRPAAELTGTPMEMAGLTVEKSETQNGNPMWLVKGNTKEHKDAIKAAGGRWNRWDVAWRFYKGDPTADIEANLDPETKLSLRRLPSFYSELINQTEALNQPAATIPQWRGIFRNMPQKGVKSAEINWSGVDTWLSSLTSDTGKVPKEMVLDYLRTQQVQISTIDRTEQGERFDGMGAPMQELMDEIGDIPAQKYNKPSLRTPGPSENYIEMQMMFDNPEQDFRAEAGHWSEENVLVHIRGDERLISGKRTFYMDELQSDWAQEGREYGYKDDARYKGLLKEELAARKELEAFKIHMREKYNMNPDGSVYSMSLDLAGATREEIIKFEDLKDRRQELSFNLNFNAVEPQPFKTTDSWSLLGFKRVLRHAAENGYDQIAWTPGEIQNDRYDLSHFVDEIEVRHYPAGYSVVAAQHGEGDVVHEAGLSKADLENIIGKELAGNAAKMTTNTNGGITAEFSGAELKVNDKAMIGFYDKIVPKTIGKYVKKFGVKVGVGKLDLGEKISPEAEEARRQMIRARRHLVNLQTMPEYDEYVPSIYTEDPSLLFDKDLIDFRRTHRDETDRWEKAVDSQAKEMFKLEKAYNELKDKGKLSNTIDVWTVPVNEEMRRSAINGLPMFARGANSMAPAEAEFPISKNQKDAKMLNSGLAKRTGYDDGWNNAFSQVELPGTLKPFKDAIKAAFGRSVVGVVPNEERFNMIDGIYLPRNDGTLYVNSASDAGFIQIAGHEMYHDLKRRYPELHEWMVDHLNNHVVNFAEYNERLNNASVADNYSISEAQEELLADFTGDAMADPAFLEQLAQDNPGKFKSLLNAVIKWLSAVKRKITGLGSDRYIEDIDALRQHLRTAINIYAKGDNIGSMDGDLQFDQSWHGGPSEHGKQETKLRIATPTMQISAANQQRIDEARPVIKNYFKRWWTKEGLTNKQIFEEKIKSDSLKKVGEEEIADIIHDMKKAVKTGYGKNYKNLNEQELGDINAYLAGNESIALPNEVKEVADVMRKFLDNLSGNVIKSLEELIALKASELSPKAKADYDLAIATNNAQGKIPDKLANTMVLNKKIENNIGSYLHRSYAAFTDANWMKKVLRNDTIINDAKDLIRSQNPDLSEAQVAGSVEAILLKAKEAKDVMSFISKGVRYGTKDLSILKKKNDDIPAEILALLGEYKNPFVNFTGSASSMQWMLANHYYLMALRQEGLNKFFYRKEEVNDLGHFTKELPDTDRLNPLSGLWTSPEIDQGMIDLQDNYNGSDFMRKVIGMNAMVKYGKTILAPTTQARNFMSAFFFSVMNGHFNLLHANKARKATLSDLISKKPEWRIYLKELIGLGVLHDNPYSEELRLALNDANEAGVFAGKIWDKPKSFFKFMQGMYRTGDDFWKIIGFENELSLQLKKGLPEAEAKAAAAYRIRNGYPTYSMINKNMKTLRRIPVVGAFVSFPYEIARTTWENGKFFISDVQSAAKGNQGAAEAAARRFLGMAIASAAAQAASKLSMVLMGISDDDDEAVRAHLPEWSRNSQLYYWGYDDDGLPIYIDVSFLDPYTYLKKPFTAIFNGNNANAEDKILDAVTELLDPFIGYDIAAGTVAAVVKNETSSGGPIYNELDSAVDRLKDISAFSYKQLAPGVSSNIERTTKAIMGSKSTSGREYSIKTELGAWVGFRSGVLNLHSSMVYKATGFANTKREATGILTKVAGSRGNVDVGDLEAAFSRMERARRNAYSDMIKYTQGSRALKISERDIRSAFIGGGMSRRDISSIMSGKIPNWRMSKRFIKSAEERAFVSEPNLAKRREIRRDMRQRRREIQRISREANAEALRLNR